MDQLTWPRESLAFLKKYRYVLFTVLLGVLLLRLPSKAAPAPSQPAENPESAVLTLEESLEQILSEMEGAGRVRVLLTQARGEEILYQTDTRDTQQDTVLIRRDDRSETGLIRQTNPPIYLGAIVLCQGAHSPAVRLALVEAVMGVTGLSSDKITVLKMK